MSDLICENYSSLLVLSRFDIALGFGDKTIGEVCAENDVDTPTFLAVINLLLKQEYKQMEVQVSIEALLSYLHNSHIYFLDYRLPEIRTKLRDALDPGQGNLNKAVLNYFDEYVSEVNKHMTYEEEHVFPYVRALLKDEQTGPYDIGVFQKQHDQVEARLTEFKHILIKYYPAASSNELNSVLFDIFSCEKDLASHNAIEDFLFVPAIQYLENQKQSR